MPFFSKCFRLPPYVSITLGQVKSCIILPDFGQVNKKTTWSPLRRFLSTASLVTRMYPPPKPTPSIELVLTTNSTSNNTISDDSDNIYYEIRTEPWSPLHTKVKKLVPETKEYEVRAEIQRFRGYPEVRVNGRGTEWVPAKEFLRVDEIKPKCLGKSSYVLVKICPNEW